MAITVSTTTNRNSGVAPLAIYFDATTTTSTRTANPFHECYYLWDFDDGSSGTWALGARPGISKNSATGPVTAHIYERPGVYRPKLTVFDGKSISTIRLDPITVQDPDVVFASSTACFSNDTDHTGSPAGATLFDNVSDFDAAINTTAGNGNTFKRILFKRGDTFTSSTVSTLRFAGPGLIGAYGPSGDAKPLINGASAKIALNATVAGSGSANFGDWRIVDLNLDAVDEVNNAVESFGPFENILFLRVEMRNQLNGILLSKFFLDQAGGLTGWNETPRTVPLWSKLFLVDCVVQNSASYGFLGDIDKFVALGTLWDTNDGSGGGHLFRVAHCQGGVISYNDFLNATGATVTIRGFGAFLTGDVTILENAWTEKIVFSNNKLTNNTAGSPFSFMPANTADDVRWRQLIVEKNWFIASASSTSSVYVDTAGDLSIRNNLFNMTGASARDCVFMLKNSASPASVFDNFFIYNNVAYTSSTTGGTFNLVAVAGSPTNLRVRNNLSYAPNVSGTRNDVSGTPGSGAVISENTDGVAISTSPSFVSGSPSNPADFMLQSGSNANGVGADELNIFDDFFDNMRDWYTPNTDQGFHALNQGVLPTRAISVKAIPSRTSGVGPLAVYFDASETTAQVTSRPFHDLYFEWDFGDDKGEVWAYGARANLSKNKATGPLAAHVYETPGIYYPKVTVFDGVNREVRYLPRIVVQDPDAIYSQIHFFSNDTTYAAGTPAHDGVKYFRHSNVTSTNVHTEINNVVGTNRAIYFERGDTFTFTATPTINADGPGTVGANPYATSGAKPILTGSVTRFNIGGNTNHDFGDWRFVDLEVDGVDSSGFTSFLSPQGAATKITVLRCDIHDTTRGFEGGLGVLDAINVSSQLAPIWNEWIVAESTIDNTTENSVMHPFDRSAFLGNNITPATGTAHAFRLIHGRKLVISANRMEEGSLSCLTMRGVAWEVADRADTLGNVYTLPANTYCEYVIVSDNLFIGDCNIQSVQSSVDTRFRDFIIERNYFTATGGGTNFSSVSNNITVRNNAVYMANANTAGFGIAFSFSRTTASPIPTGIRCDNNSFFTDATGGNFTALASFGAASTDCFVRNNVARNAGNAGAVLLSAGSATVTASGNSTDSQVRNTNPGPSWPTPTSAADFQISGGSYAIGAGTDGIKVFDDLFGNIRDVQTPDTDIGAHAFTPGTLPDVVIRRGGL